MSAGALLLNRRRCEECREPRRFRLRGGVLRCEACGVPLFVRAPRVNFDSPPVPAQVALAPNPEVGSVREASSLHDPRRTDE